MKNNYSFYSNRECEYFPCHSISGQMAEGAFSCLFCYCPLYLKDKCPGNPKYICDGAGRKIKDCSDCLYPHRAENYHGVIACLMNNDDVVNVEISELFVYIKSRIEEICGFEHMDDEMRQQHEEVLANVYHKYVERKTIRILLQQFDKSCIREDGFEFGKSYVKSNIVDKLRISDVKVETGYLYTFGIQDMDDDKLEGASLLEKYYTDFLLTCAVDVTRDWIRLYIQRKHSVRKKRFVTDSFGPGYYGIGVGEVATFCNILQAGRVGVSVKDGCNMYPAKSSIGMYLVTRESCMEHIKDCMSCVGNRSRCRYCRSNSDTI